MFTLQLEMDDKPVDLPEIEGVVVLNISSWGGGCRPWLIGSSGKDVPPARIDDGRIEVFALYSSFHIAQLQVGLAEPLRLGQATRVKVRRECPQQRTVVGLISVECYRPFP